MECRPGLAPCSSSPPALPCPRPPHSYYPSAQCLAPGVRPVVDVSLSSNEDWKLGSVALELSTTSGPDDRISTRWFGRCSNAAPLSAAPTLKDGQTKSFELCEARRRVQLAAGGVAGSTEAYASWSDA